MTQTKPGFTPISAEEADISMRPSHEVYKQFYRTYAVERFVDPIDNRRAYKQPVIEGRVLHFDGDEADRSTHLIVRQKRGISHVISNEDQQGPYEQIAYAQDSFVVATTDGVSIDRWNVDSVHGIIRGSFDGVTAVYDPNKVLLCFELTNAKAQRATLIFNSAEADGTMEIDHKVGWILDEQTSRDERIVALQHIPEDIADLGEVAAHGMLGDRVVA